MSGRKIKSVDVLALRRALGAHPTVSLVLYGVESECGEKTRDGLMTRGTLARLVGCSVGTIARWERGGRPRAKLVEQLRAIEKVIASRDKEDIDDLLLCAN